MLRRCKCDGQEVHSCNAYLKKIAALPLLKGIEVSCEAVFALGSPARSLIEAAEASQADLIVICSHGRIGLQRWVLGSVTHALIHDCKIPLLVLRLNRAVPTQVRVAVIRPRSALSSLAECALNPTASAA
jgi:hypothetical protein